MKSVTSVLFYGLLVLAPAGLAQAANLSGRIIIQDRTLGDGARLGIICPDNGGEKFASIDASGSYMISRLPNEVTCRARVSWDDVTTQSISINLGHGTKLFNGLVRVYNGIPVLIQR